MEVDYCSEAYFAASFGASSADLLEDVVAAASSCVSISKRECPTRQTSSSPNEILLTTPEHVEGIFATNLSVNTSTRSSNCFIIIKR